jgi:hypothetical protein
MAPKVILALFTKKIMVKKYTSRCYKKDANCGDKNSKAKCVLIKFLFPFSNNSLDMMSAGGPRMLTYWQLGWQQKFSASKKIRNVVKFAKVKWVIFVLTLLATSEENSVHKGSPCYTIVVFVMVTPT